SFLSSGNHHDLHSFPTRRSSDLDQGPRMTNLGNVQEIFSRPAPLNGTGLLFAPRPLSYSCPHEFERLELADRLRIRPTQIKYRRSEEHTSELQSRGHLVCRLLLE